MRKRITLFWESTLATINQLCSSISAGLKDAGINGFIVSWKSTDVLNRRLSLLAEVAAEENFKLAVIYQGLDFDRNPLPIDRISSDLDYFIDYFASKPVFQIFNKPMVIWSGTWKFSTDDIEKVASSHRTNY